ncbi:acyl-CoA dehydrogenase family protein [Caballeronia sp. KNU42]
MNLLLSEDQVQIVDTLKHFLSEQAPVSRFRPPASQIGNQDHLIWPHLAELGFLGIALPEQSGGIGLSGAEEMAAYREFGRHLLSPAIMGQMLGARVAAATGNATLLKDLLSGSTRVGLANPRGATALGSLCTGEFHLIESPDAPWVFCCDESGAALFERSDFAAIESVRSMDHSLSLERARLDGIRPTAWVSAEQDPIYIRALVLIGGFAVGLAEATRDMAVEYAKVREQFGKPIGSFQAIKHICADMAIRAEAALCQATVASLALSDRDAGANFQGTACKLVTIDAALKNAAQNIQVHGAVGFTSEADAHLYLKRAHVMDQLWGDTRTQRERMLLASFG